MQSSHIRSICSDWIHRYSRPYPVEATSISSIHLDSCQSIENELFNTKYEQNSAATEMMVWHRFAILQISSRMHSQLFSFSFVFLLFLSEWARKVSKMISKAIKCESRYKTINKSLQQHRETVQSSIKPIIIYKACVCYTFQFITLSQLCNLFYI